MVDKYEISKDQLMYTFTLRDGLKFHDGAPVRSAIALLLSSAGEDAMHRIVVMYLGKIVELTDKRSLESRTTKTAAPSAAVLSIHVDRGTADPPIERYLTT